MAIAVAKLNLVVPYVSALSLNIAVSHVYKWQGYHPSLLAILRVIATRQGFSQLSLTLKQLGRGSPNNLSSLVNLVYTVSDLTEMHGGCEQHCHTTAL